MITSRRSRGTARTRAVEAALLALLFAVCVTGCFVTRWVTSDELLLWPGIVLSAASCLALRWRRRHALPVLVATTLCTMAMSALGYLLTPLLMGPLLTAQYATSVRADRRTAWTSALGGAAGMAVTGLFLSSYGEGWILATVNPAGWVLLVAA